MCYVSLRLLHFEHLSRAAHSGIVTSAPCAAHLLGWIGFDLVVAAVFASRNEMRLFQIGVGEQLPDHHTRCVPYMLTPSSAL